MNSTKYIQAEKEAQDIIALVDEGATLFSHNCSVILDLAEQLNRIKEKYLKELESQPYHINVISMAARGKLKETAHSAILQCLLKNQNILNSFVVDVLGLSDLCFNVNEVRPIDKDRMDVSIYGKNACIIIENKVNSACEQEGQIYRYIELAKKDPRYSNDNIFVIYLNPDHYSKPTDYSLTEHGIGLKRIPKKIEDSIIIKTYSQDIHKWIKSLTEKLAYEESYLQSALHQYKDYLEEYFYLKEEKYGKMSMEFRQVIEERVKSCVSLEERISTLESMQESISTLRSEVLKFLAESKQEKETREYENQAILLAEEIGLSPKDPLISIFRRGYAETHGLGVSLNKDGQEFLVAFVDDGGNPDKFYFGIASCKNVFPQSFKDAILEAFTNAGITPDPQNQTSKWVQWEYLTKDGEWKRKFKILLDECKRLLDI